MATDGIHRAAPEPPARNRLPMVVPARPPPPRPAHKPLLSTGGDDALAPRAFSHDSLPKFNDKNTNNDNDDDDNDEFDSDNDNAAFLETLNLARLSSSCPSLDFFDAAAPAVDDSPSPTAYPYSSLPFDEPAPSPPAPPPVAPRPDHTLLALTGEHPPAPPPRPDHTLLVAPTGEQAVTLAQTESPPVHDSGEAVAAAPPTTDHRTKIVAELIETEKVYLKRMGIIIDVYMEPLLAADCKVTASLPAGAIGQVFSNIEAIRQFHENLYGRLADERFAHWTADRTKIGDIFVQLSPYLKLYLQYCNNYDQAMSTLTSLRKKHPLLEKYLHEQRDHPDCTDRMHLEHLLISPVQRIPRYILLLRDLLKHTPAEHPDYADIEAAITHLQNIANSLDKRIDDVERANHVLDIQSRVSGCPEIVHPSRYLVREGGATLCRFETSALTNAGTDQKLTFYLFNDSLLAATQSEHFKGMVMFVDTSTLLRDLPDTESVHNAFYLVSRDVNWTVRFATLAEKQQWLLDIQTQIDDTRQRQRSRSKTAVAASSSSSPPPPPRLHIFAQITATEQVKPKGEAEYTVYHLSTTIELPDGPPVLVSTVRRFREFSELHTAIKQQFPQYRFSPLPAKKAFGTLAPKTIENRRIVLESCLNEYLAKDDVAQDQRLLLFVGLNLDELKALLEPPAPPAPLPPPRQSSPPPTPPQRPASVMPPPGMAIDISELRKVQNSRLRNNDQP